MSALCIGLISGTSVDGIDAALVEIDGHAQENDLHLRAFTTYPYPEDVRSELLGLYDDQAQAVVRICSLNAVIGGLFADAAMAICEQAGVDIRQVEVIGSHGQTVWHQPAHDPTMPLSVPSTLQIGESAIITARSGVPVIADFRVADMAVGGQGAPLAPYFDWAVFGDPGRSRAIQNIGGIGNVTWLPAGAAIDQVIAFDTGPGNILMDGIVSLLTGGEQTFDRDGLLAAAGIVDRAMLGRLLADPYLRQAPPKTTGRERYGLEQCRDLIERAGPGLEAGILPTATDDAGQRCRDLIATVTAFTAHSIADAYRDWLPALPDDVLVNGGGCRNPTLMAMLATLLPASTVAATDAVGIDGDAKEAMLFALMAHDALAGYPTNVPSATGASRAIPLGKLSRF